MSRYDYEFSKNIAEQDFPFYALIMAAMRKADDVNGFLLRRTWPEVWDELQKRYNAPGGFLTEQEMLDANLTLPNMPQKEDTDERSP